jgi:PAS domain S-box-containing protein
VPEPSVPEPALASDPPPDLYRAIFCATQEALLVVDDDGRYVDLNDAYARMLKSTPADLKGRHFSEFIPPDRLDEAVAAFSAVKLGNAGLREFPLRALDGTRIPCEWNVRAYFLPGLTLCSARDISEKKVIEKNLRATEGRFRAAVLAVGSLLWTNNSAGQMEGVQAGWADFTGQSYAEYQGYGWAVAVHPDDAQPTVDAWNEAVRERRMFVFEHRVRRKDGVYRLFSIRAAPILSEAGLITEWVGVHRDITEERNATESLRLNEARFRFLARLDDAMRPLTRPEEIMDTAVRMLGLHLGADGVAWCQLDPDEETLHVCGEYRVPGAPELIGDYRLGSFGADIAQAFRANIPFRVCDIETDPRTSDIRDAWRQLGIAANLAVPLHKGGHLVASIGVHQRCAREWQPEETELLLVVASRCWESIERAHAEANLRQQWESFDTALSNTPDLIYTFDLDVRFTYANRALLSLWQRPLEDAVGKNMFEINYPPDLAARLQRQVKQVIETRSPVRDHTPFTSPAGLTGEYEYLFVPVLTEDGRVRAVAGTTRDVTERERMARALAASERKLQQIFEQAPVAIIVFRGRDFRIELANSTYEALFQGRDLRGQLFADVAPDLGQDVWDAFYRVFDTGEPFAANDWLIPYDQDGDGQIEDHWFNSVLHPLREEDGSVSGMAAVCSEVTVQVRARKELERANRELEEFAYVSSHDIQEPLRMIGTFTALLLARYVPDDPVAKKYATFIQEGVQRIEKLIRDLLTYSRVIHADSAEEIVADLNESLRQAIDTLDSRIGDVNAVVTAGLLPKVRGDSGQFAHVFQNLLSNSLKYRSKDRLSTVHISAQRNGEGWVIAVEDNGIGFEQQYAERIFGLFKRLHKDEYAGTGLGLAICQRIVERYDGRIWAEGRPGAGTTVFFSLPEKRSS